jgi:hypothetical protein
MAECRFDLGFREEGAGVDVADSAVWLGDESSGSECERDEDRAHHDLLSVIH